jgi:hypothetical protein
MRKEGSIERVYLNEFLSAVKWQCMREYYVRNVHMYDYVVTFILFACIVVGLIAIFVCAYVYECMGTFTMAMPTSHSYKDEAISASRRRSLSSVSKQGDQMGLWKNLAQPNIMNNYILPEKKSVQKLWVAFVIFIKLPKVNNYPTDKNSPNLVTLFTSSKSVQR